MAGDGYWIGKVLTGQQQERYGWIRGWSRWGPGVHTASMDFRNIAPGVYLLVLEGPTDLDPGILGTFKLGVAH